ncbi:hypothetical protein [Amycolatopsis sp. cmx-4-61]|uniref:hypothetical protein n=1 Tax=Amycolatopsis sp. cmx-4-61 TaxID=2790937 RepID=UPI00397CE2A8
MKEFESALAAAFDVRPAELPALAIDQLDGRLPAGAPTGLCTGCATRAEPVAGSICRVEPVRGCICACVAERPEPVEVRACYCRVDVPEPVAATAG